MKDFWYYVPTRVNFGPSCFQYLVDTIHQWGTKPLIVYGGGSIKRNGAYDAVVSRLKEANIPYTIWIVACKGEMLGLSELSIKLLLKLTKFLDYFGCFAN